MVSCWSTRAWGAGLVALLALWLARGRESVALEPVRRVRSGELSAEDFVRDFVAPGVPVLLEGVEPRGMPDLPRFAAACSDVQLSPLSPTTSTFVRGLPPVAARALSALLVLLGEVSTNRNHRPKRDKDLALIFQVWTE